MNLDKMITSYVPALYMKTVKIIGLSDFKRIKQKGGLEG